VCHYTRYQRKVAKLKATILWLWEHHEDVEGFYHKLLEHKWGFLVHMVQTYPALNPYLKGIHGTLESWQLNRDANGFKVEDNRKRPYEEGATEDPSETQNKRRRKNWQGGVMSPTEIGRWLPGNLKGKPQQGTRNKEERPEPMFSDSDDPLELSQLCRELRQGLSNVGCHGPGIEMCRRNQ
jgi:hypothetical protein